MNVLICVADSESHKLNHGVSRVKIFEVGTQKGGNRENEGCVRRRWRVGWWRGIQSFSGLGSPRGGSSEDGYSGACFERMRGERGTHDLAFEDVLRLFEQLVCHCCCYFVAEETVVMVIWRKDGRSRF